MSFVPGMGILKGMALTLRRFFAPKVTIRYPEVTPDIAVKYRGRLQLLYDEHGTLKCETCFQCAQACPIECIDMGGSDTKGQYAIHWGASETYGERREEAALRRAGREVPDPTYTRFEAVDTAAVDRILEDHDYDPHRMLSILEAIQAEFGHLPVAALKQVSFTTGSWYAMIYGTATYYRHFRFEKTVEQVAVCRCTSCLMQGGGRLADALAAGLRTGLGQVTPDGRMRLAWLPTHVEGAPAPLVALDGGPQPGVTPANATAWAQAVAFAGVASGCGSPSSATSGAGAPARWVGSQARRIRPSGVTCPRPVRSPAASASASRPPPCIRQAVQRQTATCSTVFSNRKWR